MSLLTSLSSSSFFLSSYLNKRINDNDFSESQFSYALKNHNVTALIVQEAKAKSGSVNWLALNRQLATTQSVSALKLARWYQTTVKKQADIADNLSAIMWFEQAIRLHSEEAVIELAQLYFDQGKAVNAINTLSILANKPAKINHIEAWLILSLKIAIHQGDVARVEQLVNSGAFIQNTSNKTESLLADLVNYSIVLDKKIATREVGQNPAYKKSTQPLLSSDCISSLQLFATNLAHLKHLDQIIRTFKAQQSLAHYICLPTPKYISNKLIDCSSDPQQAISCNESQWLNIVDKVNTRHVGLMLAKGGANVHLGMLYFDVEDNANVFSHEVSHLLGFVDEYPLVKTHNKCQGEQQSIFSHNIVVLNDYYQGEQQALRKKILNNVPWARQIKNSTPILQYVDNSSSETIDTTQRQWRLGTPVEYKEQIGLHISESCDNSFLTSNSPIDYSAYKPVSRRTQLRYYASHFPKEYLSMLEEKPLDFLMPSFHYNIALALFQHGKIEQAKILLNQAQLWEKDSMRKAAVLQGRF